jgi:hypothetical protein
LLGNPLERKRAADIVKRDQGDPEDHPGFCGLFWDHDDSLTKAS